MFFTGMFVGMFVTAMFTFKYTKPKIDNDFWFTVGGLSALFVAIAGLTVWELAVLANNFFQTVDAVEAQ